jgi:hypothetical protein
LEQIERESETKSSKADASLQKELANLKSKLEHEEQAHHADKHKLTRDVDDLKVRKPLDVPIAILANTIDHSYYRQLSALLLSSSRRSRPPTRL